MQSFLLTTIYLLLGQAHAEDIFTTSLAELHTIVKQGDHNILERVLAEDGALAVVDMPQDYTRAVKGLSSKAGWCLESRDYPQFLLHDGSKRRTFASESSNPTDYPPCIRNESKIISEYFGSADLLISELISNIAGVTNLWWKTKYYHQPNNFSFAEFKEHIHDYESVAKKEDSSFALPFHIDRGLLLMVTHSKTHPLQIRNKKGDIINTEKVGDDSLLVLMASGLPNWLLHGSGEAEKFFPPPHAVASLTKEFQTRTIFARMKVVPMDAFPYTIAASEDTRATFGEFFQPLKGSEHTDLCPADPTPASKQAVFQAGSDLMKKQCDQGQAYCWMTCLSVPDNCEAPSECINKDSLPCCTNNITSDSTNCTTMDSSCHWQQDCPSPPPPTFCVPGSGTDMFMQGFTSQGESVRICVILLFQSWILDSRAKFVLACVGVLLFGMSVEVQLWLRRRVQTGLALTWARGGTRRVLTVALFAVNLTSGYLAMLVAMTYSVELFLCLLVGMVIGHALLNSGAPVGESVDPCCASEAAPGEVDSKEPDQNTKV